MPLPQDFLARMRALLGPEYPDYLAAMEQPPVRGVRHNPLKCGRETLAASVPYRLSPSPFSPLGFVAQGEAKPGSLPAHHAGMFYAQEPSAAGPVTALDPRPGQRVLDLCAAPGGKSTQIAALLGGEGLLWCNEIVRGRANILLSNVERMGVRNAVVSSCHPQVLCEALQGWFDAVLVDAPCSGEGMFRRDPAAVSQWSPESPAACAQRQLAILQCAALAVREGGVLVYSTCTFSPEENEEVVTAFLAAHPEFEQLPADVAFGRPGLDGLSRRAYPMDGGEGQFLARLRRVSENPCRVSGGARLLPERETAAARALYESLFFGECPPLIAKAGDRLLLLPPGLPETRGLGVLRAGVELGEQRGGRIEPSHALFLSRSAEECRRTLDFFPEDPALAAFLRGEELPCGETGYAAVCVAGVTTGFGKASGGRLKNRYPKGLRVL